MKVYVVANLDQDWGIEIYNIHKSKVQADISLDIIKKKDSYAEIYEHDLEE